MGRAYAEARNRGLIDSHPAATDREIAAQWMRPYFKGASVENLLIAPGIHSVLAGLVSLRVRPGELICVESLAYPGINAIAAQFGVKLFALQLDEDGPNPHDFEEACKHLSPKALYSNPLIEDDAYCMLPLTTPAPLTKLAPEHTYYISGFSKCFGAGLSTAFVHALNLRLAQRRAGAMRATTVMASPITVALSSRAIVDGTAVAVLTAMRDESTARPALAETHLAK